MAGQGFPNEGADRRWFGFLAPLVRKLSWKSEHPPVTEELECRVARSLNPPYLVINIKFGTQWRMFRIGWRYDPNWPPHGGYILGAACKKVDHPLVWY